MGTSFPPPNERQARVIWLALTGLAVATLVALAAGLVWGLSRALQLLSPVLWPLAVAGVVAYLLDPVVDFLERRKIARPRAILLVFALALLIVAALFSSVVPQVITEMRQLARQIPTYVTNAGQRIEHFINNPPPLARKLLGTNTPLPPRSQEPEPMPAPDTTGTNQVPQTNAPVNPPSTGPGAPPPGHLTDETLQKATEWAARSLPKAGTWLFGQVGRVASWFGVLAGLALVPVYTFYFLLEKKRISSHWTDYLPVTDSAFKEELVFVLNSINNYLIAFFRGQVLVAICDGFLYGLGFAIIGLPYAVLIGVVAVFLTMVPFLGAIITCVAALIIAAVQFGDWQHPLLVLLVFGVVQALEGTVIAPKILGDRVGLHPLTIIVAVMVGTTLLGGILGGILAIPFTAALRVLMFRYVWKRRSTA